MRAMMVWGLSLCLATAWVQGISLFWRVGLGSCRPLPASRAEAWNVHGVAHVVTGPCPGGAAALPWVTCCVYCYLPGFGLWGIVDAQYVLNTSSTSLIISHACQRWTWLFGACWTALHVVGVSLFCEAGSAVSGLVTRQLWWPWFACLAAAWEAFGFVHCILDGATRGRCLIVCEAGERCVSGLALGTRQLWWPWVACLAAAWEAFECVHIYMYIILTLCLQCMDIGIDGQWYGVRHFGFRGPVSLGAWSTWRGPWAAGRPEWRVNAGCVDVYIRELDARGA